jgi:hypothetical protein
MTLKRWKLFLVPLVGALLVASLGRAASATPARPSTATLTAAVAHISSNHYSQADIDLVKSVPEVAAHVIDPSRTTMVPLATSATAARAGAVAWPQGISGGAMTPAGVGGTGKNLAPALDGEICGPGGLQINTYSILGFLIWSWVHYFEACSDGFGVTRWLTRYDYLSYSDGTAQLGALLVNQAGPAPAVQTFTMFQRQVKQCVFQIGCYDNWQPWSRLTLYADHTFSYEWGD